MSISSAIFPQTLIKTGADGLIWQRHQEVLDNLGLRAEGDRHIDSSIMSQKRQLNTARENRTLRVCLKQVQREEAEEAERAKKAQAKKKQRKNKKAGKANPVGRLQGSANAVKETPPKDTFENVLLYDDKRPPGWNDHVMSQKEPDGRVTIKRLIRAFIVGKLYIIPERHFGFKMHISSDVKYNLERTRKVTPANVYDGHELIHVVDQKNRDREVYIDKGYFSQAVDEYLTSHGFKRGRLFIVDNS